jgi:uncharacterized protein (TIGR00251 family)
MTSSKPAGTGASFILAVKVTAGASANRLIGFKGEELAVKIAAPRDKGKANRELVSFLAGLLNISSSSIEIFRGAAASHKLLKLPIACRPVLNRLVGPL